MSAHDERAATCHALGNPRREHTLRRFIEICKYQVAAKDEVKRSVRHSFAHVLSPELDVTTKLWAHTVHRARPIESQVAPLGWQLAQAAGLVAPVTGAGEKLVSASPSEGAPTGATSRKRLGSQGLLARSLR
jgi:hypothetical protein